MKRSGFPRKPSHKGLSRSPLPPGRKRLRDWTKKPPVGSRARLIRDLNDVVSLIVRKRDGRCVVCGSTLNLQCGHLFSRRYHATRWCLLNCNTQCADCNYRHGSNRDPYTFAFVRIHGADVLAALRDRAYSGRRFETPELEEMLKGLRRQLKGMR